MTDLLRSLEKSSTAEPFEGFRCWPTSEVGPIMHREAAAPSRAVLLATHQPPRIRRVTVTDAGRYGSDELISQEDVLAALLTEDQSLILPVIGASGSGKSHLVLWMRARLEDDPSPDRKIIYIPKGETSLAGVIELILDGRTGGKFDELRDAVRKATHDMSVSEAARRFRDELSLAAGKIDPSAAGAEGEPFRNHVRGHIGALLDDPVYALRLVGEGGPFRRLVEEARAGGSEEPAEVKSEDLGVQLSGVELEDLSAPARTFLSDLQAAPALHETAIAVLNEIRDACLSRVFGIEPTQLLAVIRELREQLYEENPKLELVLMIEDFTLQQGIQHDLLEAMMELPVREGRQMMCGMKTVMAVTDGFFTRVLAASDTFRTRIAAQGQVYSLDVPYGSGVSGVDTEGLIQFAGRYLNAIRVGVEGLEMQTPAIPNACEHCAHREVCHDAFGTSHDDGFGLYPFNQVALDRMVRSRQEKFNPRDLLAAMARTLTVHAQEIADGRFPSESWAREFDPREHGREPLSTLRLEVQQQVDSLPKAEQRSVLLTFWGGVPHELSNLEPGIHEAFQIPLAPEAGVTVPRPKRPTEPAPELQGADDIELAVLQWRDGGRLDGDMARILRRLFHDAILAALDPEDELFSTQFVNEVFGKDEDIVIPNAAGGGRSRPGDFQVEFAQDNEHALLFRSVLQAQRDGSWSKVGQEALVGFLARVDHEAERLRSLLRERLPERANEQAGTVALLALAGLAAGQGSASDQRGLLGAALSLDVVDTETMPDPWRVLVNQCQKRRDAARTYVLQGAHVARGSSEAAGVDGQRFLPTLAKLGAGWQLPEISESAPQAVQMLRRVLDERLAPALEDAHSRLSAWDDEITGLVGDPATVGERAKTWKAAIDQAQQAGFLVASDGNPFDGGIARVAPIASYVRGLLTQWPKLDLGRRVAGVAKAPWAQLEPWREQLRTLKATFEASLEKAETQQAGSGGASPVEGFAEALDRLAEAARLGGGDDG